MLIGPLYYTILLFVCSNCVLLTSFVNAHLCFINLSLEAQCVMQMLECWLFNSWEQKHFSVQKQPWRAAAS